MATPNQDANPLRKRRRGPLRSRDAMHAARAKPPQINPCPPGPVAGRYRPLSDGQIAAIYGNALRILEEIGMGESPEVLTQQAIQCGAIHKENDRLCFPKSMVEDVIAGACKEFVFYGRDAKHDFVVGGDRVYFGTGGAAVQTLDLDTARYRPSTLQDLCDFARLVDVLPNVAWFTRCCVATDVPDNFDLDINTAYALLKGTAKPIGTSFFIREHVDPVVDMFDMALGGEGRFRAKPFCKAHLSPVISPLRYGEDAVEVAIACMQRGMPLNNVVAAQSGATAPATIAGMLSATLAETLAALVMVNVFEPGYPMIFSNWPFVIDLRSGSFSGSGGEITLLNAASAQLSNWLGLPSGVAASMADAKAVDAQMGMEKALSSLATGLAGANMVYESSGMMASLLGASFEAFVIDDEMLSHVYRVLRGIEVSEETLGFEAIREAVAGEGHFLGADHTVAAMQRDYFYPKLSDRDEPGTWAQSGAKDLWQRANQRVRDILQEHHPRYLNDAADWDIRGRFNILV
ncbi:MAG: trimethylamine methyltransferase family protein [Arenicellales bacterium]|nr:trimethylamine methyltransferase family protein [Arenicellales bacterium]MDP6550924.1 trimethylamine methyltransferase family protein [Arenicellales bacterium]MDP6790700.1 trimethylamine methyltransferase family protein [Arenicellales bacterium]MDP6917958.1 trimethylamine methyltransferase family protein [Arenicellales bacterium]